MFSLVLGTRLARHRSKLGSIIGKTTATTDRFMGTGSNGSGLHQDFKGCHRRKYLFFFFVKISLQKYYIYIYIFFTNFHYSTTFINTLAVYGVPLQPAGLEYPERGRQDEALQ